MNKLKLLIVEDDADFRENYEKQIKLFNLENTAFIIEPIYAECAETALIALNQGTIDAAIVDLKLGGEDTDYSGNEVIKAIKAELRFPTFVLTSNPEKIEEEKRHENALYKVKVKGSKEGSVENILAELASLYSTGVTKILGRSGQIEKYLHDIFWKHLAASIDSWKDDATKTSEQKEKSLLRYTLAHLMEYLDLDGETGSFSEYNPMEFFLSPVIKSNIHTGEIVKDNSNNELHIILTPACDMAQAKAKDIVLAKIELSTDQGALKDIIGLAKKETSQGTGQNNLKDIISNRWPKYHFIPQNKIINSSAVINFQKIKSLRSKDLSENYTRIAQINGMFIKDIIARFSYYYSRQGAPDFNKESIYLELIK